MKIKISKSEFQMTNVNSKFRISNARRGSALLITLLMLGVLMTLVLGISTLVIREIGVTQSIVDANKAYYSAEAGVENALLDLSRNKPGFEPVAHPVIFSELPSDFDPNFKYDYDISNTSDHVPGFSDTKPIFVEPVMVTGGTDGSLVTDCKIYDSKSPFALAYTKDQLYQHCVRATFRKLPLTQTDIVPLFSADSSGGTSEVNDFLVEYYLNIKDGSGLWGEFQGLPLNEFDVLRWKIYGQPKVDNGIQRTESIADFYPGYTNNGPNSPVCIGTDGSIGNADNCIYPSLSKRPPAAKDLNNPNLDLNDVTLWSAARECYQTDAGSMVTGGALIKGTTQGDATGCSMRDFIDNHKENYLILTNMVNPNIVGIQNTHDPSQLARADIYYRVVARKAKLGESPVPKLVKDFATISAQGYAAAGQVVKSLEVQYKAPGFLPVFNFSLYKTLSPPESK
jgi:hypothetical protein